MPNSLPFDAHATMHAVFTDGPIHIDGELSETVWRIAPAYPLTISRDRARRGAQLVERGSVQLAHGNEYFYVALRFNDSDLIAEGDADQLHHYLLGDTAELFLKPVHASWYLEMYVTPRGHKTVFFFPDRQRARQGGDFETRDVGLTVAAKGQAALNESSGWTGEMAISKAKLSTLGMPLSADEPWTILVSRYNYTGCLESPELSMCPPLSRTNFHLTEEYATLVLDLDTAQSASAR
jgi:hypothetical protein